MLTLLSDLARKLNCDDGSLFNLFQQWGAPMLLQDRLTYIDEGIALAYLRKQGLITSPTPAPLTVIPHSQTARIAARPAVKGEAIGDREGETVDPAVRETDIFGNHADAGQNFANRKRRTRRPRA